MQFIANFRSYFLTSLLLFYFDQNFSILYFPISHQTFHLKLSNFSSSSTTSIFCEMIVQQPQYDFIRKCTMTRIFKKRFCPYTFSRRSFSFRSIILKWSLNVHHQKYRKTDGLGRWPSFSEKRNMWQVWTAILRSKPVNQFVWPIYDEQDDIIIYDSKYQSFIISKIHPLSDIDMIPFISICRYL